MTSIKRLSLLPLFLSLGSISFASTPATLKQSDNTVQNAPTGHPDTRERNYFREPLEACRDKFGDAVAAKHTPRAEAVFQEWLTCMRKKVKEI